MPLECHKICMQCGQTIFLENKMTILKGVLYMILSLQEAINRPLDCEEQQLKNWLITLNEYFERDTDMQVEEICLLGNSICPACGERMALGVENFCDKCGQKIKIKRS